MTIDAFPADLRELPRWVLWRQEQRGGRPTKVPYRVDNPQERASSTDGATWATFSQAVEALPYSGCDGLGIVLGDGLGGVDLDACRDPKTGEIDDWAQRIIDGFATYSEVSPSGTGVKVYAGGAPGELPASTIQVGGPSRNGKRPAIECYVGGRYFCVTGEALDGHEQLRDAGDAWESMVAMLRERAGTNGQRTERDPTGATEIPDELRKVLDGETAAGSLWREGKGNGQDRSRNDASLAATLGTMGFEDAAVEAALRAYPLGQIGQGALTGSDAERQIGRLLGIAADARSEARRESGDLEDDSDLSHDALALDLGDTRFEDGRYVDPWGRWLFWEGSYWETDESLLHMTLAREFLRDKADQLHEWAEDKAKAGEVDDDEAERIKRWAKRQGDKLKAAHTVAAVVGLARSNRAQAESTETWDRHHYLMGTTGRTIDLRTGKLRQPRQDDYITKAAAVEPAEPGTPTPLWDAFLDRIMDGNVELIDYLQRLAGYSLTGSIEEHVFAFAHGGGGNGKGTFFGTLQAVMGDYAQTIPVEALMVTRNERHPTEIARLRGVRLAVGSETERGKRWAESRIKSLTGGDRIAARKMRQDYFEFDPTFKLVVHGNHKPSLYGVDEAIRRRLHLVPFDVKIPADEKDTKLKDKLQDEWPGILRWAIDGCLEWQRRGLDPPASVSDATDKYLHEEDTVGRWLDACCDTDDPRGFAKSGDLYDSWTTWAEAAGEYPISKKRLGQELGERGFDSYREPGTGQRGYIGLTLREDRE